MRLLFERPALLFSLLLATMLAIGAGMTKLASEPAAKTARIREPMPEGLCGHAVSEWLREHGEDD